MNDEINKISISFLPQFS